jgi:mycoredoxin
MVEVYGADWCGDTKHALAHLDALKIDYEYIDVEQDEKASDWVKSQNEGKERKPTIKVGENVLSVPTENELDAALQKEGLI